MRELMFAGHGIEVIRQGETYLIRFDAGEVAVSFREVTVSLADSEQAMRSEADAYEVLLHHQNAPSRDSS